MKPAGKTRWPRSATNIHVHDGVCDQAFLARRSARDKTLGMPLLMLPSVQVNVRAGYFQAPEDNVTAYLKILLNVL